MNTQVPKARRIRGSWIILLILSLSLKTGWAQPQSFRGIVVSSAPDRKSFVIVDRSGNTVTIQVGAATSFEQSRAVITFTDAIRFGMDLRGTFASDGSAAQVSARGIVDEIEVSQMQAFLGASDAEWAILRPKIEKVESLQRVVEGRNPSGNNDGNNQGDRAQNPIQGLEQTLRSAFFDMQASGAAMTNQLNALRQARTTARVNLAAAQRELTELLTTRQEVLLVVMGILE